ncbi:hypothetical protein ACFL67_00115 [candidate division KSB1 bacterium]
MFIEDYSAEISIITIIDAPRKIVSRRASIIDPVITPARNMFFARSDFTGLLLAKYKKNNIINVTVSAESFPFTDGRRIKNMNMTVENCAAMVKLFLQPAEND